MDAIPLNLAMASPLFICFLHHCINQWNRSYVMQTCNQHSWTRYFVKPNDACAMYTTHVRKRLCTFESFQVIFLSATGSWHGWLRLQLCGTFAGRTDLSHLHVCVVRLSCCSAVTRRRYSHVTGYDVAWPHVTGGDPEVTSLDRKSRGSGCRRT